ncbi:hypothetical protein ACFQ60_37690 [Streptomyces zhihengii]
MLLKTYGSAAREVQPRRAASSRVTRIALTSQWRMSSHRRFWRAAARTKKSGDPVRSTSSGRVALNWPTTPAASGRRVTQFWCSTFTQKPGSAAQAPRISAYTCSSPVVGMTRWARKAAPSRFHSSGPSTKERRVRRAGAPPLPGAASGSRGAPGRVSRRSSQ